jgi:uncharacterized membrane protein HdeD (DUF308 family)
MFWKLLAIVIGLAMIASGILAIVRRKTELSESDGYIFTGWVAVLYGVLCIAAGVSLVLFHRSLVLIRL